MIFVQFVDLLSTMILVTESVGDVLSAATDWAHSPEFADLMSTVAAVTEFGACLIGTVI